MSYIDLSVAATIRFEGSVAWMYLDTLGNVTVGVGILLDGVSKALALPFVMQGSLAAATPDAIEADFRRVAALNHGMQAIFYKDTTSPILPYAAINAVLQNVVTQNDRDMQQVFSAWSLYPEKVKLGILDMVYNLGETSLLKKFPRFVSAVKAQDWATAAVQCQRDGVGSARNTWTASMFSDVTS